jgi:hypothetical protein
MTQLPERPFFIVGSPRSGTTLLRYILSSHPRIYIPAETGFIPFLPEVMMGVLTSTQVRRILLQVGRLNREWYAMVEDVDAFCASLPEPTLAHVLDALYRQKIVPFNATRWGDKTPAYVLYMDTLSHIFPTAQFVHMVRDGRDVMLSAQRRWGQGAWYMDSYYLLKNWVRYVERGRESGCKLKRDQYLEVSYEALVQQPESTVREICAFLDERFYSAMLTHTKLARKQIGSSGHVEVRQPIFTASVQRWRTQMNSFEQKLANRVAGRTLLTLGYEQSDPGPFSLSETMRLFLLAGKYWATDMVRRTLMALGILTLNRGKRRR